MATRENVLLTCLSKVDFKKHWTNYIYFYSNDHGNEVINELKDEIKDKDKDKEEINKIVEKRIGEEIEQTKAIITDGILTNEAPAKIVLSLVYKDRLKELNDDKADSKRNKANIQKNKDNGGKLDRIVVLCSDDVQKKIGENPELNDSNFSLKPSEKEKVVANITSFDDPEDREENSDNIFNNLLDCSHYAYFQKVVKKALKEMQRDNENNENIESGNDLIPEFLPVNISNNPGEYDIAKAAIEAANFIIGTAVEGSETKEIHLYIDYNSGPRYIASMLLNTANLLEQRGVTIKNILTMSYENKIGEYVPVESFMGVLQSSRLVSGIKEFVDYGRCRELRQYFDPKICRDEDIQDILKQMEDFSEYLETCDTEKIFGTGNSDPENVVEKLRTSLESYKAKVDSSPQEGVVGADKNQDNTSPFRVLFEYVAKDILKQYEHVFSGDLLKIIDWCCDKGFIQQAVTFCYERIPIYFWDHQIYYPSEEEEKEYIQVREVCKALKAVNFSQSVVDRQNQFSAAFEQCSLPDDPDNQLKVEIERNIRDAMDPNTNNRRDRRDRIDRRAIPNLRKNYMNYDWKFSWSQKYIPFSSQHEYNWMNAQLRTKSVNHVGPQLEDLTDDDKKLEFVNGMLHSSDGNCDRAKSCKFTYDDNSGKRKQLKKQFFDIMYKYQKIREQRNMINHAEVSADDSANVNKRWSYNELKDNLKDYIKQISDFMK